MATLYRIVGALAIVSLFGVTACAPAATPTPTVAPATTAPAKPAAKATTAAKESSPATPTAKPAAAPADKPAASASDKAAASKVAPRPDWKAEWDKVLAEAKKEGKVVVAGGPGNTRRASAAAFQKAYPDIKLEFSGISSADFLPKVTTERAGGQFLWDIHMGGAASINGRLRPTGAVSPIRPALILPEILDDSKWLGGFESSWADKGHEYVFAYSAWRNDLFMVNRDFVPESELSKIDQLLEPKWKGKIVTQDPRAPGTSGTSTGWIFLTKGEEWLRKYYQQDLVIVKDNRAQMDAIVRGRQPIAFGPNRAELLTFQSQGLGKNIRALEPGSEAGVRLTGGSGYIVLMNKAPNPNAAKVFINWMLSQDGQKAHVAATGNNSRRLDVEGPPETAPDPKVKYRLLESEELYPNVARANNIAKEVIK